MASARRLSIGGRQARFFGSSIGQENSGRLQLLFVEWEIAVRERVRRARSGMSDQNHITSIERQMMIKIAAIPILAFPLLCSLGFAQESAKPSAASTADNTQTSRLRMFGQNGASAVLARASSCAKNIWSEDVEKVSGGMGSAFSSFIGTVSNTSLGIAETDTTRNLSKKDGMLSKAYFREYVIPADKPSTMSMGFQDVYSFYVASGVRYDWVKPSCRGAITFTPRAGEDYEAAFVWEGKVCRLSVNQVVTKDGTTELIPMPVTRAPDC